MPAVRAYSPAEVIACGLRLENSSLSVTQSSLHAALGGLGMPRTAFATWKEFVEARGKTPAGAPTGANDNLSPVVAQAIAEATSRITEIATTAIAETNAVHERRAGAMQRQLDEYLRRSEEDASLIETLRAEVDRLRGVRVANARER